MLQLQAIEQKLSFLVDSTPDKGSTGPSTSSSGASDIDPYFTKIFEFNSNTFEIQQNKNGLFCYCRNECFPFFRATVSLEEVVSWLKKSDINLIFADCSEAREISTRFEISGRMYLQIIWEREGQLRDWRNRVSEWQREMLDQLVAKQFTITQLVTRSLKDISFEMKEKGYHYGLFVRCTGDFFLTDKMNSKYTHVESLEWTS